LQPPRNDDEAKNRFFGFETQQLEPVKEDLLFYASSIGAIRGTRTHEIQTTHERYSASKDEGITMSGNEPPPITTQEMTGIISNPSVEPASVTQDIGGPSDPVPELDLEDPIMQFVVHNFDRMNAMYKAFARKLKELPPQPTLASTDPPIIEPLISDSDDVRSRKAKEPAFVESDNNDPSNNRVVIKATPLLTQLKRSLRQIMTFITNHSCSKSQTETYVV